jgi:hypothetical protein
VISQDKSVGYAMGIAGAGLVFLLGKIMQKRQVAAE